MLLQHCLHPLDKRGVPFGRLARERQAPVRLRSVVVRDGNQIPTFADEDARLFFPIAGVNQLLKALISDVGDNLLGVVNGCVLPSLLGRLVAPGLVCTLLVLVTDDSSVILEWPCQKNPGFECYAVRLELVAAILCAPLCHKRLGPRVIHVIVPPRLFGFNVPHDHC